MDRTDKINRYKYYYALMDFLVLSVSFVFTLFAMTTINSINAERLITPVFPLVIFLFMLSILFIFEFNQLYTADVIRSKTRQLFAVMKSLVAGSFYIFLITVIMVSVEFAKVGILVLSFAAIAFSLLYVIRIEILRSLVLREKAINKNLLLIGDGKPGKKIASNILNNGSYGVFLSGMLINRPLEEVNNPGINVIGTFDELEVVAASGDIDEIIISSDSIPYTELFDVIDRCNALNIKTRVASELLKVIPDNFKTERYFGVPVIEFSGSKSSVELKRFTDVFLSLMGIIVLMPLFIVLAIIIKLTSKGPVLFKHQRIGINGKPFNFYKFRSMYSSDEDDNERKEMMLKFMSEGITQDESTKIVNEKRITPIGKIIRKYSIDELPQLLNVIRGEMSLVGPRPCLTYEFENYQPWQRKRVQIIPGCTGVWQITGRSTVSFNESVLLDLFYINKRSPLFDILIILKTIPVMIFSKGGK